MEIIGILFGLISLFGFVGIFVVTPLHKKVKITKRWQSAIVWFVAAAIANPFLPNDQPKQKQQTKPVQAATVHKEQAPKPKPVAHKALPLDQVIKKSVDNALNYDKSHIMSIEVNDDAGTSTVGDKIVILDINADENVTDHLTAEGMLMDAQKIFPAVFRRGNIAEVDINFYLDMVDVYGKTSHDQVMKIGLTKDTFKKIDWNNFIYSNFPQVADLYQAHPAIQKALNSN